MGIVRVWMFFSGARGRQMKNVMVVTMKYSQLAIPGCELWLNRDR